MQSIFPELRDNLLATVDYPPALREAIGDAAPWQAFCSLPEKVKQKFAFEDTSKDTDAGYTHRAKKEGREDKEYYHFDGKKRHEAYIQKHGVDSLASEHKEIQEFLHYADRVYEGAAKLLRDVVKETSKDIPELYERLCDDDGSVVATLRFLHYFPAKEEETLAAPHYDRGGYTLHLFETHEGLQYLDWNYVWHTAPVERGKTVVFSGYKLEKFTKGACQKTWHRVIQLPDVAGKNTSRVSMVLFCGLRGVEGYHRDARAQLDTPRYERASV